MDKLPRNRHSMCPDEKCRICLADSMELRAYLEHETADTNADHLGRYALFLDRKGIESDSGYGWFSDEAFNERNIIAYIFWWNEGRHECEFCNRPAYYSDIGPRHINVCEEEHYFAYISGFEDGTNDCMDNYC